MRKYLLVTTLLTTLPVTAVLAATPVQITPGSGSVTDCSGDVWSITTDGSIKEGANYVPGGGGTSALTLQGCTVYGKDSGLNPVNPGAWFTMTSTNQSADQYWMVSSPPTIAATASASPTAAQKATSAPATTQNTTPVAATQFCTNANSGPRDPTQTPFASTSVFNLPLGSGAQWTSNTQLAGANVYVNTAGNYNENIYTGTASDPLVTVTNTATAGGTPGTYTMHIPAGAVAAGGTDKTFSLDDTTTHTWYGMGSFTWTSSNTATVSQASAESDSGSGIQDAMSNWDEGVGTLRESDLLAGTINHMLRLNLPASMLYGGSSTDQLVSNAWPQTFEDGFALNGNGGPAYSGTIPFGVTIGIPMNAVEPADVAANPGANMLWHALHDHGAMVRDQGGSAPTATFQADQNVNPGDPLLAGMQQYGAEIMAQTQILANQGPNSINGGGTPVVPLDPEVSDAANGSSLTSCTLSNTPPTVTAPALPTASTVTTAPDAASGASAITAPALAPSSMSISQVAAMATGN